MVLLSSTRLSGKKAINLLDEKGLLIKKEGYDVATDREAELMGEMRDINVPVQRRRYILNERIEELGVFDQFSPVDLEGQLYNVKVTDFNGNHLQGKQDAPVQIKLADLYDIQSKNFQNMIEELQRKHQSQEQSILVVPRNKHFNRIDELIRKIHQYETMWDRYGQGQAQDKDTKDIVRGMQDDKDEKILELNEHLNNAIENGVLVRGFEEEELNKGTFKSVIKNKLSKVAAELFTKQLSTHVDRSKAEKILTEKDESRLSSYLEAKDFQFFDDDGQFIGEHRKPVDEITHRISDVFIDGGQLEEDLTAAPYGWELGDIITTLAALLRAERIKIKFQGEEILEYDHPKAVKIFSNTYNFREAQFQRIEIDLSQNKKEELIDVVDDIDRKNVTDRITTRSPNIHIVKQIPDLAEEYIDEIKTLDASLEEFTNELFNLDDAERQFSTFAGRRVDEDSYKDIAEEFINQAEPLQEIVDRIHELKSFQKNKLNDLRNMRSFVNHLQNQKAYLDNEEASKKMATKIEEFQNHNENPVQEISSLTNCFQDLKDLYYDLMEPVHESVNKQYEEFVDELEEIQGEARKAGKEKNKSVLNNILVQTRKANAFTCDRLSLVQSTSCDNCQNSLKELQMAIENLQNKREKLFQLHEEIEQLNQEPEVNDPTPEPISVPKTRFTVSEFREWMKEVLDSTRSMEPDDHIEIHVNSN